MSRRIAQLGVAAALAATAFLPSSASADIAIPPCVDDHLNVYSVNAPGFATCTKDVGAALIVRVGTCTSAYQPLGAPFGSQVVPQTQAYVDCL